MPDLATCAACGSVIPADSPGAQCPRCLLEAGLAGGAREERAAPPTPDEIGKHFPALEVLELLGQGGMGIVYKARQRQLDRLVALKVLPPEVAREPGFAERFAREAKTLAKLQHPHIVGVYDFGEADGLYYLLMEYVDGPNLRQVIRDGHLDPAQALAIVPQVCDALQYAHDRGVVHRDIKPENVLLDQQGRVKIADFGLAKLLQREPVNVTLTRAGQLMGTLHYMAPEQMKSPDTVDHRADIYSLGVVFYEMLTGELPLGTFPPPSEKPGVDVRLDAVVLRALERERDRRWQHASDVRSEVDTISRIAAPPGTTPSAVRTPEPSRLSSLAWFGGLSTPIALIAGAALILLFGRKGGDVWTAAVLGAVGILVLGIAVSIAGLVQISRSAGRLHGTGWAVTGLVLAPVCLLLGLGVFAVAIVEWVDTPPSEPPFDVHSPTLGDPWAEWADFAPAAPPAPRLEGQRRDESAAAVKVVGGPERLMVADRARIAAEVEALWARVVPVIENEPNPDVKLLSLAPGDRATVAAMTSTEREFAQAMGRLGLPFRPPRFVPSLEAFRLVWVVLSPGGDRARVVMAAAQNTIAYPVVKAGGAWHAELGTIETGGPLRDQHRAGWLDQDWFGSARDPAERVSGGPATLTDVQRHELAMDARGAWRNVDESHGSPLPITLPAGTRLSGFRVFHIALEATGTKGRLVVSDGAWTMAFLVTGVGKDWTIVPDGDVRKGPAQPDDRDGTLEK